MSIKRAAMGLIKKGVEITDGILNKIEMAFRAMTLVFRVQPIVYPVNEAKIMYL
jgi:hypothetical protein